MGQQEKIAEERRRIGGPSSGKMDGSVDKQAV